MENYFPFAPSEMLRHGMVVLSFVMVITILMLNPLSICIIQR